MTALVCQMPENQRIHIKDLREKKNQTYAKNISDLRIPVPPSIAIYQSQTLSPKFYSYTAATSIIFYISEILQNKLGNLKNTQIFSFKASADNNPKQVQDRMVKQQQEIS